VLKNVNQEEISCMRGCDEEIEEKRKIKIKREIS